MGNLESFEVVLRREATRKESLAESRMLQGALTVDVAVPAPPAKRLTLPPKQYAEQTPKQDKRSVCHNRSNEPTSVSNRPLKKRPINIPILDGPRRDKITKPISSEILVNGDSYEQAPSNRFIRVHSIRANNTR